MDSAETARDLTLIILMSYRRKKIKRGSKGAKGVRLVIMGFDWVARELPDLNLVGLYGVLKSDAANLSGAIGRILARTNIKIPLKTFFLRTASRWMSLYYIRSGFSIKIVTVVFYFFICPMLHSFSWMLIQMTTDSVDIIIAPLNLPA